MNTQLITEASNIEDWKGHRESDIWVSEAIWGHRLHEQPLHGLLLEFLGMAEGMFREGKLLDESTPGQDVEYRARKAPELRVILFHNPSLEQIAQKHQGDDEASWEAWFITMRNNAKEKHPSNFDYLKERFPKFKDFVNRVDLIRRGIMNAGNAKQWNYQMLYPMGPDALYIPTDDKFGRNRILFTRTGEIAYLMLTRADKHLRDELKTLLEAKFNPDSQKNKLVASLLPDRLVTESPKGGTHLPYKKHPAYNRLAKDLLNLLKLELPENDVFDLMKYLLAFNLYVYALETTQHTLGQTNKALLVCEILNTKSDLVRKYSGECKRENEDRAIKAVEEFFNQKITGDQQLSQIIQDSQQTEEVKVDTLKEFFVETMALKKPSEAKTLDAFRKTTVNQAIAACRRGVIKAQSSLGRTAGLITKQGTNRLRYCPNDSLIRVLVLVNVQEQVEEAKLLDLLYERYRIVISKKHAEKAVAPQFIEASHYEKNKERFNQRLIALGLGSRRSDACTYVQNPYH